MHPRLGQDRDRTHLLFGFGTSFFPWTFFTSWYEDISAYELFFLDDTPDLFGYPTG